MQSEPLNQIPGPPLIYVVRATVLVGNGIRRGTVLTFTGADGEIVARSLTTADRLEELGLALVATAAAARTAAERPAPIGASPHCEVRLMAPLAGEADHRLIDRWLEQRTQPANPDDLYSWARLDDLISDYRRWAEACGLQPRGAHAPSERRFLRALSDRDVVAAMRRQLWSGAKERCYPLRLLDQPVDTGIAA